MDQRQPQAKEFTLNALFFKFLLFSSFLIPIFFTACKSVDVPPKKVGFIVRDNGTGKLIPEATIEILEVRTGSGQANTKSVGIYTTNRIGTAQLSKDDWKTIKEVYNAIPDDRRAPSVSFHIKCSKTGYETAGLRMNKYLPFYEIYLENPNFVPERDTQIVADMHYHVSMRVQNSFGHVLTDKYIPTEINWYSKYAAQKVLYDGAWVKFKAKKIPFTKKGSDQNFEKARVLLERKWVRPKGSSNSLQHFTQATLPHMKEGNVYLGFNAISPFEYSVSNDKGKKTVSNVFKSGADLDWLNKMGARREGTSKNPRKALWPQFSHWENFNSEYKFITSQEQRYNNFNWRFYNENTDLKDSIPTIINVVEGGHILQSDFFPHQVDFDLGRDKRSERENTLIYNHIQQTLKKKGFRDVEDYLNQTTVIVPSMGGRGNDVNGGNDTFNPLSLDPIRKHVLDTLAKRGLTLNQLPDTILPLKVYIKDTLATLPLTIVEFINERRLRANKDFIISEPIFNREPERLESEFDVVNAVLTREIANNITILKEMEPPVYMMAVSHLTYNGMTGHAPALDDGKFPANLIAQKAYSIRVSDDRSYQNQWKGLFFAVPGPNEFGKVMMSELMSPSNNSKGRKIYIDLKHSDYVTRKYFYNEFTRKDSVPPICSHCAVTGLPSTFYSPFNDEYSLRKSPSTTTFYPFGINLYDDEIREICQYGGIIGIPLEQRVIGGYINTRISRFIPSRKNRKKEWRFDLIKSKRWAAADSLFHFFHDMIDKDSISITTDVVMKAKVDRSGVLCSQEAFLRDFKHAFRSALNYTKVEMMDIAATTPVDQATQEAILELTYQDYISAEPFLQNLFYIVDNSGASFEDAWEHICIGSDLDGLIDPIDMCPSAGHYPHFRARLKQFIPIFLAFKTIYKIPKAIPTNCPFRETYGKYFDTKFTVDDALEYLFYKSLADFSAKHFK